jgi:hypothetical protein
MVPEAPPTDPLISVNYSDQFMSEITIQNLYEIVAKANTYCGYLTLIVFVLRPKRVLTLPFLYFFFNNLINSIFDVFAEYFHTHHIMPRYFEVIVPFYGINNFILLGIFFSNYATENIKKHIPWISILLSVLLLVLYLNSEFQKFFPLGYLFQNVVMILLSLVGLRSILLTQKKLTNRKSYLIICLSYLLAFLAAVIINLFLKSTVDISKNMMYGFHTIKIMIYFISSLFTLYAIAILIPKKDKFFEVGKKTEH